MSKDIKYKVFSIRLNEETKKKLIKGKEHSGLSWNRYILTLVDEEYRDKQK